MDDFEGSTKPFESLFIAGALAEKSHEFYLRVNQQWMGQSKWVLRALRRSNPFFADEFAHAFNQFYKTGDKKAIITLVDSIMAPYGGRWFEGFSLGK